MAIIGVVISIILTAVFGICIYIFLATNKESLSNTSNTKKFYLAQKSDYHRPPLVKNKLINKIPKEYETIEDLDWFLNN
jgi:hypothetical protein